jgi:hypothetical protein
MASHPAWAIDIDVQDLVADEDLEPIAEADIVSEGPVSWSARIGLRGLDSPTTDAIGERPGRGGLAATSFEDAVTTIYDPAQGRRAAPGRR